MSQFKDLMRKHRKQSGISQLDLARLTDMSRASIVRYESGKTIPRLDHAIIIAEKINMPLDELRNPKNDANILSKGSTQ